MPNVTFVLKEPKSTNETLVYLIYRFHGQKLKYSTSLKILPKFWNPETQKARETRQFEYAEFNQLLTNLVSVVSKPSSAFNVRIIKSDNTKSIGAYLTKYVTKNASKFDCQVWNCSKKISALYTCFYSGIESIRKFERLEKEGFLDGKIKVIQKDYCNVCVIPINSIVMKLYEPISQANILNWNVQKSKI